MKIAVTDDYQGAFTKTKAYPKLSDHDVVISSVRRHLWCRIDQIVAFAQGKPINVVNPEAQDRK